MATAHVIGGGLAGLAAGLTLADAGYPVRLYEAGPQAGGRCRSYHDPTLGCRVDNGNHLLLSGNTAAMAFLARIGSRGTLTGMGGAAFPFVDLATRERWVVRPNRGPLPWWLLAPRRRVPGAGLAEFAALLRLHRAPPSATVADCLRPGEARRRLLDPLAIAALNTAPETGSARLLGAVVRQTLAKGGGACVPLWPAYGLSASFVDPALACLRARGGEIALSMRIGAIEIADRRVVALIGPQGRIAMGAGDLLVVAVPPWVAAGLIPGLVVPDRFEAIFNLHFRAAAGSGLVGLIGGTAEWVFAKPEHLSVTISAANRLLDADADALAARVWGEVCVAFAMGRCPLPAWRLVREKRATFAATPDQERRRPGADLGLANAALAGDFTRTGLPATIEGAIRSGRSAANLLLNPSRSAHAA